MSSKAPLIIGLICCFCLISSSIGGVVYWKRCDLGLTDCPSPSPSPDTQEETPSKDSGEDCLIDTDCKSGLKCVQTSTVPGKQCYSIEDCRSKRIENEYIENSGDVSCGKSGCMDPVASNYDQNAVYEIPGTCLTDNVCEALDFNNDGFNKSDDFLIGLRFFGVRCDNITDNQSLKDLCYSSQPDVPSPNAEFSQELLNKLISSYDC